MRAWTWFETKMYGRPLRPRRRGERLKLLLISMALGLILGVTLFASGLSQSFLASGLRQAGYDPSSLFQNAAGHPATQLPASTPPPTTPLPVHGGGWVTPAAP